MKPKPVVRWPGGKTRMLSKILPLLRPHSTYVEAFGGGLAVLLAKLRSPGEGVNDINGDVVRRCEGPLKTAVRADLRARCIPTAQPLQSACDGDVLWFPQWCALRR